MWVVKEKGYREYNKTMCYRDSSVISIGISARSVHIGERDVSSAFIGKWVSVI